MAALEPPADPPRSRLGGSHVQLWLALAGGVFAASAATLVFVASWFYGYFGVTPEEVGLGPTSSRVHAVIGITLLMIAGVALLVWAFVTGWIRAGKTKRERTSLSDRDTHTRVAVVVGAVIAATLFQLIVLSVLMVQGASGTKDGTPVGGWLHPTSRVTVTYLDEPAPGIVTSLQGCLIYLGNSDNVTVLFNATNGDVVRLPTSNILVVAPIEQQATPNAACDEAGSG